MWLSRVWLKLLAARDSIELAAAAIGILAIVPAVVMYLWERPDRSQAAIYGSWGIVSRMEGKRAAGGRIVALSHLRASGEPLAGLVLSEAVIADLDLSKADLSLARLENVRLTRCSFRGAILSEASLVGGRFEKRCDFGKAILDNTGIHGARFVDSIFIGAQLLGAHGDEDTSFNGASLNGAVVSNTELPGANFDNTVLGSARFTQTGLENATFHRSVLDGMHMSGVRASGAQFQRAVGVAPVFDSETELDGAIFDSSRFEGARFDRVSLRRASAFGATWHGARFSRCDLTDTDFAAADLTGATVCECIGAASAFGRSTVKPTEVTTCPN